MGLGVQNEEFCPAKKKAQSWYGESACLPGSQLQHVRLPLLLKLAHALAAEDVLQRLVACGIDLPLGIEAVIELAEQPSLLQVVTQVSGLSVEDAFNVLFVNANSRMARRQEVRGSCGRLIPFHPAASWPALICCGVRETHATGSRWCVSRTLRIAAIVCRPRAAERPTP
jgi:hypothetical protein